MLAHQLRDRVHRRVRAGGRPPLPSSPLRSTSRASVPLRDRGPSEHDTGPQQAPRGVADPARRARAGPRPVRRRAGVQGRRPQPDRTRAGTPPGSSARHAPLECQPTWLPRRWILKRRSPGRSATAPAPRSRRWSVPLACSCTTSPWSACARLPDDQRARSASARRGDPARSPTLPSLRPRSSSTCTTSSGCARDRHRRLHRLPRRWRGPPGSSASPPAPARPSFRRFPDLRPDHRRRRPRVGMLISRSRWPQVTSDFLDGPRTVESATRRRPALHRSARLHVQRRHARCSPSAS